MNDLEQAALAAATDGGAPPKVWPVGPDADVRLGKGLSHPFDGMQLTGWVDNVDVITGRCE